MRVELENRFNAERVIVKAEDGVDLDCAFMPAFGAQEISSSPTMLIWNPNAGYYEYSYY